MMMMGKRTIWALAAICCMMLGMSHAVFAQNYAQIATGNFSSVPGLKGWWKADTGVYTDAAKSSAATTDGSLIYTWADQSGNGNDLVQSSSGARPVLRLTTNGIGGKPALKFSGAQSINIAALMGGGDGKSVSVYVVMSQPPSASPGFTFDFNGKQLGIYGPSPASLTNYYASAPLPVGANTNYSDALYEAGGGTIYQFDNDAFSDVQAFTYDGTNQILSSNNHFKTIAYTSTLSLAGPFAVGNTASGSSYYFTGNVSEVIVCNVAHSATLRKAIESALANKYSIPAAKVITGEGDSITYGAGGTSYLALMQTTLPIGPYFINNASTDGETLAQMLARGSTLVDPTLNPASKRNILTIMGGTNDLTDSSTTADGTSLYNELVTYCRLREAAGWRVIVVTMLPRYTTSGGFAAARDQYNSLVRANWQTFASGIADVGNDAVMGQDGQNTSNSTDYISDHTHPTTAGETIIDGYVQQATIGGAAYAQNVAQTGVDNGLYAGTVTPPGVFGSSSNTFTFSAATGGTSPYAAQLQRAPNIVSNDSVSNYDTPGAFADVTGATSTTNGATLTDATTSGATKYWWRIKVTDSTSGTPLVNYSNLLEGNTPSDVFAAASISQTGSPTSTTAQYTSGTPTGGTAPYTYQWYLGTTSGHTGSPVSGATSTVFNAASLAAGTTYYVYCNYADSASGTASSSEMSFATASALGAVLSLTGTNSIALSWDALTGAVTYNDYRDGSLLHSGLTGTTDTDSTASAGSHSYTVKGVDSGGTAGTASSPVSAGGGGTTIINTFQPSRSR